MRITDQFSDPAYGTLVALLTEAPALEAYVKEAELDTKEAEALPDTAFAWPEQRKFPIHTPQHVALSYAYAKHAHVLPAPVKQALHDALEVHGLSAESELFRTPGTKEAEASSDEDWLLPEHHLFPCKTAAELERSERLVLDNLQKLDLPSRATACGNLVKRAGELGVKLNPHIERLAGFVVSSTKVARQWLEARAAALPPEAESYKLAYLTLAEGLKGQPPELRDRPALLKLASAIGELDEKSGLTRHYDRRLPDALQTVFNTTKQASATVDLGGRSVSLEQLAALPPKVWEDLGGPELYREVAPGGQVDPQALAQVVDTLPLDLKHTLAAQLGA